MNNLEKRLSGHVRPGPAGPPSTPEHSWLQKTSSKSIQTCQLSTFIKSVMVSKLKRLVAPFSFSVQLYPPALEEVQSKVFDSLLHERRVVDYVLLHHSLVQNKE